MTQVKLPNWTVLYNINSGDWIGTGWEFFNTEGEAQAKYDDLLDNLDNKFTPTKRPYHHETDKEHLAAYHSDIKAYRNPGPILG